MYSASVVDRLIDDLRSATGDLDKLNKESAEFYLCLSNIDQLCNSDIYNDQDLDNVLSKLEHDTDINAVCQDAYEGVARLLKRELFWRSEAKRLRKILVDVFGMDHEQVYTGE